MNFKEAISQFKQLTEEQKQAIKGYKSVRSGEYGPMNQFMLQLQSAPEGEFISMSELKKGGYDFKGAKVYYVVKPTIKENSEGEEVFKGWAGYGKVIHISQVKKKEEE